MLRQIKVMAPEGDGGGGGGGSLLTPPAAPPVTPPAVDTPPKNSYDAADWRHALPDDVREDLSLRSFNDVPSLAKSFLSTKKMVGADKVTLPNKHWTPEEYEQFYDRLGRPALDKYDMKLPKDAKFVSQEWVKELAPIAHKAGLRPEQVEPLLGWYESKIAGTQQAADTEKAKALETNLGELKKEWGEAYDKKLSYARTIIKEHADLKEVEYLEKSGLTNDPKLARFFAKLGEAFYKEDQVIEGEQSGGKTPADAKAEYNTIMMDSNHAYRDANHPNHKKAVDEMARLFKMMHPEEKTA